MSDESRGRGVEDRVAALEAAMEKRTRDLQAALDQRTALLHELDHRVKNNLQLISSLMLMQARRAEDPPVKAALIDMQQRLTAVGVVHRRLFQSDDVTRFDLSEFVRDMAAELGWAAGRNDIEIVHHLEPAMVPASNAASLALLVNELMANAFRHAFPHGRAGRLSITIAKESDTLRIEIADNGVGQSTGGIGDQGFGLMIVELLARQLQACIERKDANPGLLVSVTMPAGSGDT